MSVCKVSAGSPLRLCSEEKMIDGIMGGGTTSLVMFTAYEGKPENAPSNSDVMN